MRNEILAVCVGCAAGALEHWLGLRAYAEHVEGIGAVGTSLQLILLGLCELLSTLILLAVVHAGRGYGDEQIGVVVAVDEHLQTGTPAKHIIDESVLLYVVHRVAEISLAHRPAHRAQRAHHLFMRVIVVQAPVGAHHGRVVVEDDLTTAMIVVVRIEVVEQLRNLALVFDEERFEHAQLRPLHLTDDEPVDEVVSVEGYQQRLLVVAVGIHATVVRQRTTLGVGEVVQVEHALVGCCVEVGGLAHAAVEAVSRYAHTLAHDRRGEGERWEVALGTAYKLLAQECEVLD